MLKTATQLVELHSELAKKRKELFDRFVRKPEELHFAREIKLLDDQIVECSERLTCERKAHS
jgi:hypothetical protein